jgi:LmbE family N-acetylglucosaminyl deacetylase
VSAVPLQQDSRTFKVLSLAKTGACVNQNSVSLLTLKTKAACEKKPDIQISTPPIPEALPSVNTDTDSPILLPVVQTASTTSPAGYEFLQALPVASTARTPEEMQRALCQGKTVVNIVAHEDDDLLFMNPDVQTDIKAGKCIRTVFVTAGDAGDTSQYWLAREKGSEAAYAQMLGIEPTWTEQSMQLTEYAHATIATPTNSPKVSLIFMHLPDGNLSGQGFFSTRHESLERLEHGIIDTIQSVDGLSSYTAPQLVETLQTILQTYKPVKIRTQSTEVGAPYPDHSDHRAVGYFVSQAYDQYQQNSTTQTNMPLLYYTGYSIRSNPENLANDALVEKALPFFKYAAYDKGVCITIQECDATSSYGAYLHRQYQASS